MQMQDNTVSMTYAIPANIRTSAMNMMMDIIKTTIPAAVWRNAKAAIQMDTYVSRE